ncbi:MAG: Fic family protein [Actinomycetota bacterium]|nr:Fic family protein [Actinomycetota bacterium]
MTQPRRYESSHPWLKFGKLDLRRAPAELWMLLGEAGSKVEHLRGVPLRPEAQNHLQEVYLAKGVWATTSIEGNTLSEDEVRSAVQGRLKVPPSREYQRQEVQNIIDAVNQIATEMLRVGPKEQLSPGMIADFNRMVLKGLELDPDGAPGEYRNHSVAAGPYVGAPAEDLEYLTQRLCTWLNSNFVVPEGAGDLRLVYVITRAVLAHLYLEWIHPFADGNGRTGRLLEFQILVAAGVPFPAAHLLSNHYNLTRTEYYRQLQAASRSGGDVLPFLFYAVQGFVDGLRSQIQVVQEEQMSVMWETHVHHTVTGTTQAAHRQRTLVLELGEVSEPVPRRDLMSFSPPVAREYQNKTSKTLTRDLTHLRRLGLIRPVGGRWMASREEMRAFLPAAVAASDSTP